MQGMIVGKCRVLCTAEADFNAMPSSQHIEAADHIFSRAFDCDNLEVTTLDDVVEALGGLFHDLSQILHNSSCITSGLSPCVYLCSPVEACQCRVLEISCVHTTFNIHGRYVLGEIECHCLFAFHQLCLIAC